MAMTEATVENEDEIERASPEDLMHLASDIGPVPMQVGALLILDAEPAFDVSAGRQMIAQRIHALPRLRQRLVRTPWGCGRPIWVEDPAFDIRHHVRSTSCLPPGDEHAVLDLAATLVTDPLPRSRPLWSATFVTGLAAGNVAVVLAFHHVLADGIGGLAVLAGLVDGSTALPGIPFTTTAPSPRHLAVDAWTARLKAIRHPAGRLRRLRSGLAELGSPRAVRAPHSSLNQPTGPSRHLAVVRTDLAAVHDVAHQHGGSVNDVVLTAVTGALNKLLDRRGEKAGGFAVSVPVSGRRAASAVHLGNQVGSMPLMLPATGGPLQRLRQIALITRARKTTTPGTSAAVLGPLFRVLSAAGVLRWFMNHQRMINTFVANVHGPADRLTFNGSAICDIIPVSGAFGNVTVAFAVLSYAGALTVTVVADRDHCPDLQTLAHALQTEFDTLVSARVIRSAE
jgi:diacylglycerol O-acyltransferase / wax synthase